jgi:hypothetical protein
VQFSGADVSVWGVTATEEPSTGAIVQTAAAAVDTGTISWTVDNTPAQYWISGTTVVQSIDTVDGTCWVTGDTLRLSGGAGTECVGSWRSLQVKR